MHLGFFKDSGLYIISVALMRIMPILLLPFISRVLSVEDVGILELTLAYVILGYAISTLSIEAAIGRYFYNQENLGNRTDVVSNGLIAVFCTSLIGFMLIAIFAEPLARILLGSNDYTSVIVLAGAIIVFGSIFNIITAVLRFLEKISLFFIFGMMFSVVSTVSIIVFTLKVGMVGFLWGQLLGFALSNFALLFYLVKIGLLRPAIKTQTVKRLLQYSVPIVPGVALMWATLHGTRAISSFTLSAVDIGILSVAMRMASVVKLGEEGLKMIWSPYVFKNILVDGHQADFRFKFYVISTLVFCAGSILQLISFDFYDIIVPAKYLSGHPLFCILVSVFCFTSIIQILLIGPIITKITYLNSVVIACGAVIGLLAVVLLIKPFGFYAVPLAMLLSAMTLVIASWYVTEKLYYIGFSKRRFLGPVIILALSCIVAIYYTHLPIVRWSMAAAIIGGFALWLRRIWPALQGRLDEPVF